MLGAWDLISWEESDAATGEVTYPSCKNVVGQIIYDASGRMSGQIMNLDRSKSGSRVGGNLAWVSRLTGAEAIEVLGGCISYFGRYDIDEAMKIVAHHVMGMFGQPELETTELGPLNFSLTGASCSSRSQHIRLYRCLMCCHRRSKARLRNWRERG